MNSINFYMTFYILLSRKPFNTTRVSEYFAVCVNVSTYISKKLKIEPKLHLTHCHTLPKLLELDFLVMSMEGSH